MSAPSAQERKACWDSRDLYWQCLDDTKEDRDRCQQIRKGFEKNCPQTWVGHMTTAASQCHHLNPLLAASF
ncbi:unnamed protein product [Staurois parvus]|uniref:Cytochrome c oxidase assembly factor 6 homolog n=1 Tax=Staurois parvus TaxID=386267 RepID=A0ABN9CTR0_9NEOB|nr:unnamed protein product [Staurois parvus]